ncbi:MAG: DUF2147 domain-containing protein [Pseudomonadota bacterium]
MVGAGAVAVAAEVTGVWRTEPRNSGAYITVEIHPCPVASMERCGRVVGAHGGARPELIGEDMLRGLKLQDDGSWSGGEIVSPKSGDAYRSNLHLLGPDRLKVEGCVAAGLICSGQVWTRVQ